eukprot:2812888-Amphidinium_carterae.1
MGPLAHAFSVAQRRSTFARFDENHRCVECLLYHVWKWHTCAHLNCVANLKDAKQCPCDNRDDRRGEPPLEQPTWEPTKVATANSTTAVLESPYQKTRVRWPQGTSRLYLTLVS